MIKQYILKVIITVLLAVAFFGCKQDDVVLRDPDKLTRPLSFAAPVIKGHFNALDLIERMDPTQYLLVDDEGLIHFRVEQDFSEEWSDLMEFDTPTLDVSYDMPTLPGLGLAATITFIDSIRLNTLDSMYFDSLFIKTALLSIGVTVPAGYVGNYSIKFPELIKANGDTVIVSKNFNDPIIDDQDLSGARLTFIHEGSGSYYTLETTINISGTSNPAPGIQSLLLHSEIKNLNPELIFGYFGTVDAINYEQEISLDFFESSGFVDMVQFKGISIELFIDNYIGVPLAISIDSIVFQSSSSGREVQLNLADNIIKIDKAEFADQILPTSNNFLFNMDNSNLDDAMNIWPNKMYVKLGSSTNPDRDKSIQNFISTDLTIEAWTVIDIPFWFKTSNYERIDTLIFDVAQEIDSTEIDYLEKLTLSFEFDNGFPFEISAQVYMVTEQGQIIDSLFSDGEQLIWDSPEVDVEGKAIGVANTKVDIILDHDQVERLHQNKSAKILIQSRVMTGKDDFVKLFANYTIDFSLGFEIVSGEIKL